jgi:hypothetical protein
MAKPSGLSRSLAGRPPETGRDACLHAPFVADRGVPRPGPHQLRYVIVFENVSTTVYASGLLLLGEVQSHAGVAPRRASRGAARKAPARPAGAGLFTAWMIIIHRVTHQFPRAWRRGATRGRPPLCLRGAMSRRRAGPARGQPGELGRRARGGGMRGLRGRRGSGRPERREDRACAGSGR